MGIKKFEIEVPNKSALLYFPNETIEGILHVETEQENKTEGITVTILGKGRVQWSEGSNSNHFAEEEYVNEKTELYGTGTGSLPILLPPGVHRFPFRLTLPLGAPASFQDVFGKITYEIKAEMQRPWLINHKATTPFTVNGILDLNNEEGISQPMEVSENKNLGCFSCKSGPIGFTLRMSRTGYVPGEFLQFNASFSNQSTKRVKGVTASLIQWIHYHASWRTKSTSQTLCQSHGPNVEPWGDEIWSGNVFEIPQVPPSRLGATDKHIIDVQYFLKIEMQLPGPSINLRKEIPLIIGNIPLRNINE